MKNTVICADNVNLFAYVYADPAKESYKGIVLVFHGLGGGNEMTSLPMEEYEGAHDYILVYPYNSPWSWMNDTSVKMADEIVDAVIAKYGLPEDVPVISTGASMGGLASLVFTHYTKRTPVRCATNCGVCDLPYHYTERADLPKTLYCAFAHYDCTLEEALLRTSPLHLVETMPHIPYYIAHCDEDGAVNKQKHSDRMVQALRETGHNVVAYDEVPGKGHCQLEDEHLLAYYRFIFQQ